MKFILLLQLMLSFSVADIIDISFFEADFTQEIIDDKGKALRYDGHVKAAKPQSSLWQYIHPVEKNIYINKSEVVIVEPELEQVILKKISNDFDILSLIKNAKKINNHTYIANFNGAEFQIIITDSVIGSLTYKDEFENSVKIIFTNQKQNITIPASEFTPRIPTQYDIIRG